MEQKNIRAEVTVAVHRSEIGYVRNENQDRFSDSTLPAGNLYIVADGMGGHQGGALAAELTVRELQRYIGRAKPDTSIEQIITQAFREANRIVYEQAHCGDEATAGMGSTAVLLLINGACARVAHVGDSRAYLFRQSKLQLLTKDHTVVQKMVDAGLLTPQEASRHPHASILERAIGNKPDIDVEISEEFIVQDGDAFLLCSDGISGYVPDEEIEYVIRSSEKVHDIPNDLIQLALEDRGGQDNATVQFIQIGTRQAAKQTSQLSGRWSSIQRIVSAKIELSIGTLCLSLFVIVLLSAGVTLYLGRKKLTIPVSQSSTTSQLEIRTVHSRIKNDSTSHSEPYLEVASKEEDDDAGLTIISSEE